MRWRISPPSICAGRLFLWELACWSTSVWCAPLLMPRDKKGRRHYADPIPKWLNLEYGVYRPLLQLLAQLVIAAAVLADRTGPYLVFRVLPSAVRKLHRWVLRRWNGLVRAVTGEEYLPGRVWSRRWTTSTLGCTPTTPTRRRELSILWRSGCCSPGWGWSLPLHLYS